MAKIKVHELAKELEIKSKDVITFLQEKGVDVKAAQSSIEGDAVEWVKKSSITIKKLKSGKRYYIQVRAVKKNGTAVKKGAWSTKKSVRVK